MSKYFNEDKVTQILTDHPQLRIAFKAGLISRKVM